MIVQAGFTRIGLLLLALSLYGCDAVLDCLDDDGPVFNKGTLEQAVLNQEYADEIVASVRNEPFDARFDYRFVFTGSLPQGVMAFQSGRRFVFEGTPTESGLFRFTLYVEVDDGLDPYRSNLCFRSRSTDYRLTVREI